MSRWDSETPPLPTIPADTFGPGVPQAPAIVAITVVLYAFCLVFAVNSAIHSYLIVAYAEGDKVGLICWANGGLAGWRQCRQTFSWSACPTLRNLDTHPPSPHPPTHPPTGGPDGRCVLL